MRKFQLISVWVFQLLFLSPVFAILDSNNNGLSDVWEKQYHTTLLNPSNPDHAPTADPDQDGWTNAQEALAGTNPFDSSLPIGRTALTIQPAAQANFFELTWPVIPGKHYRIQASTNLLFWFNVGPIFLAEQGETIKAINLESADPEAPNATSPPPRLFYRVKIIDRDEDADQLTTYEEFALGLNHLNSQSLSNIGDLWLATHFFEDLLNLGLAAVIAAADTDTDGRSKEEEFADGTDPKKADTDDDGLNDGEDADPLDPVINWRPTGKPSFAVIEIVVANPDQLEYVDHSPQGTILLRRHSIGQQTSAVIRANCKMFLTRLIKVFI